MLCVEYEVAHKGSAVTLPRDAHRENRSYPYMGYSYMGQTYHGGLSR